MAETLVPQGRLVDKYTPTFSALNYVVVLATEATSFITERYDLASPYAPARYKYVASEPVHALKKLVGSRWFEIDEPVILLAHAGNDFERGLFAARKQKKKLLLPEGVIELPARVAVTSGFVDDYVDIEGPGSDKTIIKTATGFAYSSMFIFTNLPVVSAFASYAFNNYSSSPGTTVEYFSATIAGEVKPGAYKISYVPGSDVPQVGDIIRVKTTRMAVQLCESRKSIMHGEINQVVAVNGLEVTLRYPVAEWYLTPGVIATGTASAGSTTTMTYAGLDKELIVGQAIRITAGTGSGQTRYIEDYDEVTGVINFASMYSSGYSQEAFSPVPDNTSVFEIFFTAYVQYFRPGTSRVKMKGFTCFSTEAVATSSISIRGVIDPVLDDVKTVNFASNGPAFSNCIHPVGNKISTVDANDTALGYHSLFTECRDSELRDIHGHNNRAGPDCSGTIPSWGLLAMGGSLIGGYADRDGVPWSKDNVNRGLGDHGQSRDWVYESITIEGCVYHCVQRGMNVTFRDINHRGRAQLSYYRLSRGKGTVIDGYTIDARLDAGVVAPTAAAVLDADAVIYIDNLHGGRNLHVTPGTAKGFIGPFICMETLGGTGPALIERQLFIARPDAAYGASTRCFMFAAADGMTATIQDFTIERPVVRFEGAGTFKMYETNVNGEATILGEEYTFSPSAIHRNYVRPATWLASTTPVDNNWNTVAWSPELGIMVSVAQTGTGDRVMTSPDGITWTSRVSPADEVWRAVCWSPERGLFVAVANSNTSTLGQIMTSPDGITWTQRATPNDRNWNGVVWAPDILGGRFVCVNSSAIGANGVMTSEDGITWTMRTGVGLGYGLAYSKEQRRIVAINQAGNTWQTSKNGSSWTAVANPSATATWVRIVWAKGIKLWVAVAGGGAGDRFATSPDGITWTLRAPPIVDTWNAVAWSDELGLLVALGSTFGTVATSTDGINWVNSSTLPSLAVRGMTWIKELGIFVTVGLTGTGNRAQTSVSMFKYPYRS